MAVAKVIEISSGSKKSFEHAIEKGIAHASKSLKNITGAWVNEQSVVCHKGKVTEWRVNLKVTFVIDG